MTPWDIAGAQGDSAPSQRRVACEPRELRSLNSCALAVSPRGLRRRKLYLLYSEPPLRGGGLPSPAGRAPRSLAAPPWEAIPALGGVRYAPPPIPRPWRRRFARHQSLAALVKKKKKRKNSIENSIENFFLYNILIIPFFLSLISAFFLKDSQPFS